MAATMSGSRNVRFGGADNDDYGMGDDGSYDGAATYAREEAEEEENPFRLPAESEIATYRDRERAEKSAERERQKKLRVYEKLGNRMRRLRVADLETGEGGDDAAHGGVPEMAAPRNQRAHDLAIATRDRHIEKEQLQDYIQKKREMFLVQYALGVKKDEMQKLENITETQEKMLEEAEEQLEADAAKFDQFLKDNDRNSAEAIQEAETQTKLKMDKTSEIKALQSEIATLRSDISKNEDSLKEFHTFRKFLDGLAPESWLKEQRGKFKRNTKKRIRRSLANAKSMAEAAASGGESSGPESAPNIVMHEEDSGVRLPRRRSSVIQAPRELMPSAANPDADPELENIDSWEPELFFAEPKQLLDIYAELEAHNLSLITNGQETEEALQDVEERGSMEEEKMGHETGFLQSQIDGLEKEIAREEDMAWLARERASYFSATNLDKQEIAMQMLDVKVGEVYAVCIGENEANISTLQMLTNIENRLEELFEKIAKMPPSKVEEAERAKEKQRRLRAREEKIEQQRLHQEERVRRALERAQAAPKRQTGRRLVFRSAPPKQKKANLKKRVMATEEEEEMRYYFGP